MPYNILLSNGDALIAGGLLDNTADSANTSLVLVGKNYKGYGLFLNQNFTRLLENFANATAPANPLPGQIWFNSSTKRLNVNISATKGTLDANWKNVAGLTISATAPGTQFTGELWYDSTNGQLNIYTGTGWRLIGPLSKLSTGNSGAIPDTVTDAPPSATFIILRFILDNVTVAIWSNNADFNSDVPGFPVIRRGLNLNTAISQKFYGTSTIAETVLVGATPISANNFLRNDQSSSTVGALSILNDTGLSVGAASDFVANVNVGTVTLRNQTNNRDFILSLRSGGTQTPFLRGNNVTGLAEVYNNPTALSPALTVATKNYVDILSGSVNGTANFFGHITPSANLTYTLGNTTNRFTNIFSESILVGNVNAANTFATISNVASMFLGADIIPTANNSSNIGSSGMRFNTLHSQSLLITNTINVGTSAAIGTDLTVNGIATFNSNVVNNGNLSITSGRTSVSTATGALIITGGAGIGGNLHVGGQIVTSTMPLGTANTAVATTAFVQNISIPTGALMMWSTASAPTGWLLCNGSAVSRTVYAALFAVIGTTFGVGDGSTTFNLPNYNNRVPVGAGGLYALAATGGSKDSTVVSHTHTLSGGNVTGTFVTGVSRTLIEVDSAVESNSAFVVNSISSNTASPSYTSPTVNSAGTSGTDANMPPYLAMNFIIKT